jgi:hypothetical protein
LCTIYQIYADNGGYQRLCPSGFYAPQKGAPTKPITKKSINQQVICTNLSAGYAIFSANNFRILVQPIVIYRILSLFLLFSTQNSGPALRKKPMLDGAVTDLATLQQSSSGCLALRRTHSV